MPAAAIVEYVFKVDVPFHVYDPAPDAERLTVSPAQYVVAPETANDGGAIATTEAEAEPEQVIEGV
jgi:hypothetical protein